MPKELDITSGSLTTEGYNVYKAFKKALKENSIEEKSADENGYENYFRAKCSAEAWELGEKAYNNLKKYGASTWYDWRLDNWGTKWDTCENQIDCECSNYISFSFDTAWGPPLHALYELSKQFPEAKIEFFYYDQDDVGSTIGEGHFLNGECELTEPETTAERRNMYERLSGDTEIWDLLERD